MKSWPYKGYSNTEICCVWMRFLLIGCNMTRFDELRDVTQKRVGKVIRDDWEEWKRSYHGWPILADSYWVLTCARAFVDARINLGLLLIVFSHLRKCEVQREVFTWKLFYYCIYATCSVRWVIEMQLHIFWSFIYYAPHRILNEINQLLCT
jgi:hypothetical protein